MNKSSGKKSRNFLSLQREKVGGKIGKNSKGKKFFRGKKKTKANRHFPEGRKNYIYYVYIQVFSLPTSGVRKRGFRHCPFYLPLLTDKTKFSQEVIKLIYGNSIFHGNGTAHGHASGKEGKREER